MENGTEVSEKVKLGVKMTREFMGDSHLNKLRSGAVSPNRTIAPASCHIVALLTLFLSYSETTFSPKSVWSTSLKPASQATHDRG